MWVAKKYYFSASGLFVTVTRLALLSPLVHFYLRVVSWYTRGSYSKLNSVEICSMKKKEIFLANSCYANSLNYMLVGNFKFDIEALKYKSY